MSDQMINQRPADQQGGIEERGLARRSEPRGLSRYEGFSSPFELMRRFSEDVERRFGSFYRTIPLPEGVKADNAQAHFNNGVLEVTLPGAAKTLQPQRRNIPIQAAGQQQSRQIQTGTQTQPSQQQTNR